MYHCVCVWERERVFFFWISHQFSSVTQLCPTLRSATVEIKRLQSIKINSDSCWVLLTYLLTKKKLPSSLPISASNSMSVVLYWVGGQRIERAHIRRLHPCGPAFSEVLGNFANPVTSLVTGLLVTAPLCRGRSVPDQNSIKNTASSSAIVHSRVFLSVRGKSLIT